MLVFPAAKTSSTCVTNGNPLSCCTVNRIPAYNFCVCVCCAFCDFSYYTIRTWKTFYIAAEMSYRIINTKPHRIVINN